MEFIDRLLVTPIAEIGNMERHERVKQDRKLSKGTVFSKTDSKRLLELAKEIGLLKEEHSTPKRKADVPKG